MDQQKHNDGTDFELPVDELPAELAAAEAGGLPMVEIVPAITAPPPPSDDAMGSSEGVSFSQPQKPLPSVPSGEARQEFVVNLVFRGSDRPRLRYRVYSGMSVRLFYHLVASRIVGCADDQIRMYVDDYELRHLGSITDRFYPDFPDVSTPYLFPECVVDVEQLRAGDRDPKPTKPRSVVDTMDVPEPKAPVDSSSSTASRRTSSRIRSAKETHEPELSKVEARRPVRDKWYYPHAVPMLMGSSDVTDDDERLRSTNEVHSGSEGPAAVILGPVGADPAVGPPIRLNRLQWHNLVRRFNAES